MVDAASPVSHRDIVAREGGSAAIAKTVSSYEEAAGRPPVEANAVKAWKRNDSIPAGYWEAFKANGLATLDELAAGAAIQAAARRNPAPVEAVQ